MSSPATFVLSLWLGTALHGEPPAEDLSEAVARFEKSCTGSTSRECKQLQWQIEAGLYGQLRSLVAATGRGLEGDVLRVALAADTPQLKAFALRRLPGNPPADLLPLVVAALDSPYAMVREAALNVLHQDARYARYGERRLPPSSPGYPVADEAPGAAALGGPVYPGARFRPFASNDQMALFSSPDAADKVVAFYAKGNRRALTPAELTAEQKKKAMAMSDPMAMMELVKKAQAEGKDPSTVIMARQKEMMGGGASAQAFDKKPGVVSPRFIALDDAGSRRVLVFSDEVLGGTSIVFFLVSAQTEQAMSPAARATNPMQGVELQQFIHQPLIESEK